jgi:hypothetical protein
VDLRSPSTGERLELAAEDDLCRVTDAARGSGHPAWRAAPEQGAEWCDADPPATSRTLGRVRRAPVRRHTDPRRRRVSRPHAARDPDQSPSLDAIRSQDPLVPTRPRTDGHATSRRASGTARRSTGPSGPRGWSRSRPVM